MREISKSGYPLELEVHSILNQSGWTVESNSYYFDYEEQKSRSIDVFAYGKLGTFPLLTRPSPLRRISPFDLRSFVCVECKKSETDTWVFFTQPSISTSKFMHFPGQYIDFGGILSGEYSTGFFEDMNISFDLTKQLHFSRYNIASTFTSIKMSKKQKKRQKTKDDIFEAANQLVKYIAYRWSGIVEGRYVGGLPTKSDRSIRIAFPIIVFDGRIFEAQVSKGEIQLSETNHVLLSFNYQPRYFSKHALGYIIDVVNKDNFENLLHELENDYMLLFTTIEKNLDHLKKEADKLVNLVAISRENENAEVNTN